MHRYLIPRMKEENFRTVMLAVCTMAYLLIGPVVLNAMEGDDDKHWELLSVFRKKLLRKYNKVEDDKEVLEALTHRPGSWNMHSWPAIAYAVIAFGHAAPATVYGKIFYIVHGLVGIPLGVLMFHNIGQRINRCTNYFIRRTKFILGCSNIEPNEKDVLIAIGIQFLAMFITGAVVFSRYEDWTYYDSIQYGLITMVTFGHEDGMTSENDSILSVAPGMLVFRLVFSMYTVAVIAAVVNLLMPHIVLVQRQGQAIAGPQGPADDQASVCTCNCPVHVQGAPIQPFQENRLDRRASF